MNQALQYKKHFLLRSGFGPAQSSWPEIQQKPLSILIKQQFQRAASCKPLLITDVPAPSALEKKQMSKDEKMAFRKESRQALRKLNLAWIAEMGQSPAQLREKMAFFWHDHFACRIPGVHAGQLQLNTLRQHALGDFGSLVKAIAKDPAMLLFLNNQQNKKAHPNENFARELLELFMLGRGKYTEKDIKEAARAFTGWGTDAQGNFVFRRRQHDFGEKSFMGRRGNFDGNDIIDIVLEHKACAYFLTEKIYRFFVNPEIDPQQVATWAETFYQSGYGIAQLMESIFRSDHFYQAQHIGSQIKSPVEYMVHLQRLLGLSYHEAEAPLFIQHVLGQVLFTPPNVAGWPHGTQWIDSSSLLTRMQIPQAIIRKQVLSVQGKASFAGNEDKFPIRNRAQGKRLQAEIHWQPILEALRGLSTAQLHQQLSEFVLQVPLQGNMDAKIAQSLPSTDPDTQIKLWMMRLLASPEFQLS